MFCPECGKEVMNGTAFCSECGHKIEVPAGGNQGEPIAVVKSEPAVAPSFEPATEPASKKFDLVKLANKKELRTNIAVALLVCALFAPIFSILGILDLSAWRIINISVLGNVDIPTGGGVSFSQAMAMVESQIPSNFDFGITLLNIGFYVFALSSIGVFVGNIRKKKIWEERFALAGIISGVALFVAILIISGEVESMIKAAMGYSVSSGMTFSSEAAQINMIMEYLSPFKLLAVGYWGTMALYVISFVFNKKRTDD